MTRHREAATTRSQGTNRAPDVLPSRRAGRHATPFVTLDRSRCEACWKCIAVCPESVLGKIDIWLHRHAVVRDGDQCRGCHLCVKVCATGALSGRDGAATVAALSVARDSAAAVAGPQRSVPRARDHSPSQ